MSERFLAGFEQRGRISAVLSVTPITQGVVSMPIALLAVVPFVVSTPGAAVFAAGAFDLVESVLEPDAHIPDRQALHAELEAGRLLENLWAHLATP